MKALALLVFLAGTLFGADVSGHWSGAFTFITGSGEKGEALVLLILKQDGEKITGTGGRDEADRHDIIEGKIAGDKIILEVEAGNSPIRLELTVAGEEMKGDVTRTRGDGSKQTAKALVKRVKP
jgi:hypothetical protein